MAYMGQATLKIGPRGSGVQVSVVLDQFKISIKYLTLSCLLEIKHFGGGSKHAIGCLRNKKQKKNQI